MTEPLLEPLARHFGFALPMHFITWMEKGGENLDQCTLSQGMVVSMPDANWRPMLAPLVTADNVTALDERLRDAAKRVVRLQEEIIKQELRANRGPRRDLISQLAATGYLTHKERFVLLMSLIESGWTDDQIVEVYRPAKNFIESKTRYYIGHARDNYT